MNKEDKKANPLISVVVPIYNVEKYLEECVQSILRQTYRNLEIILVDDESPDSCGILCDDFQKKDNRIRVIHKKNGGLSDARNAGIEIAGGEYITFVDSDDYLDCGFIEELYKSIREGHYDIAISKMKRTNQRNEEIKEKEINKIALNAEAALNKMLYGKLFSTSACGKLYKMSLFMDIRFPYGKFSEDLFTIYQVFLKSDRVVFIDYIGYYYYYREEGSLVVSKYNIKQLEAFEAMEEIKSKIGGMNQFKKAISSQYINIIFDIALRNPKLQEFKNNKIQENLKSNRRIVLFDSQAPLRLRCFALLSWLGNSMILNIIKIYSLKWKK